MNPKRVFPRQFSLASLVVTMALAAIVVAFCMPDREWLAEQNALQQIAAKGAVVRVYSTGVQIDFTGNDPPEYRFTACGGQLKRTLLATGRPAVFDNSDVALLKNVSNLLHLNLKGTNITTTGSIGKPAAFIRIA